MIYSGKKLLILGGSLTEIFIIERARKMGIYTIVSDQYTDRTICPAKNFADEAWGISWKDIDTLYTKCIENDVDGVLAGFSEFRVDSMIRLCKRLKTPTYITSEQLFKTSDKTEFKHLCEQYSVPTVPTYDKDSEAIEFPVIVKPVDRGGSIGISVVYNIEEYKEAIDTALSLSPSGKVIVEKYMGDSMKFDVYYIIQHGEPILFTSNDTEMCPRMKGQEILQAGWVFPSKYQENYIQKVDTPVKNMLKGLGINNGYITISGFVDEKENMYIFETGFRLSGDFSFKFTERFLNFNYIDQLIEQAIYGDITPITNLEKLSNNESYMLVVNYFANNGIINSVSGEEEIHKDSTLELVNYINSKEFDSHGGLLRKAAMLYCYGNSKASLNKKYREIFNTYDVTNPDGESLVYYRPIMSHLLK